MKHVTTYIALFLISLTILSCEDIIDVVDITDETVTVLAPTNGATIEESEVVFSWSAVDGAEDYRLQIAAPNFENATTIILDSVVTTTTYTQMLNTGNYQWRVRAQNTNYQTAYTSQGLSIALADPVDISNAQVVLLAPASGTSFMDTDTISFSWETVTNADSYVIQIATPSFANATSIIENETVSSTSFSVSNLAIQSYEWRVKAINANYETAYTTQNFIVEN